MFGEEELRQGGVSQEATFTTNVHWQRSENSIENSAHTNIRWTTASGRVAEPSDSYQTVRLYAKLVELS